MHKQVRDMLDAGIREPSTSGRLARWALELQGHRFEVDHRKGALNHVPGALSRVHDEIEPEVCSSTWAESTQDKKYLSWLRAVQLRLTDPPRSKVIGGQIYTYRPAEAVSDTLGVDDKAWKLVVPSERRRDIMHKSHDAAQSAHLGRDKTDARVAQYYYWPGMYKDVAEYVRTCEVCQRYKADQRPPAGFMGVRIIERPWQWVAGDIMGLKPRTRRGF